MGKIVLILVLGIILGIGGAWGSARWQWQQFQRQITPREASQVGVYPESGQKLSAAPEAVRITFPQPVTTFEIDIRRDFDIILEADQLHPKISADGLTLTQPFPATSAGTGTFTVTYKGCPKDASSAGCFSGQYDFTVEAK